jgi:hypothetical protein
MRHRHINTTNWSSEAIYSILERGDLPDWKELFRAARTDAGLAAKIREIANRYPDDGTFVLANFLARKRDQP